MNMSFLAKLRAGSAVLGAGEPLVTEPVAPVPAPDASVTAAAGDVVPRTEALAAANEAEAAGATAERTRTNAVLSSPAGKANMGMAAFMLHANPSASADQIIGHLESAPKADASTAAPVATEAAAAPGAGAAAPITVTLAETPLVELGGAGAGANEGTETAAETASIWKASNDSLLTSAGVKVGKTGN